MFLAHHKEAFSSIKLPTEVSVFWTKSEPGMSVEQMKRAKFPTLIWKISEDDGIKRKPLNEGRWLGAAPKDSTGALRYDGKYILPQRGGQGLQAGPSNQQGFSSTSGGQGTGKQGYKGKGKGRATQ